MKTCACCGIAKEPDKFGVDHHRKDGLNPYCNPCRRTKAKATRNRYGAALNAAQKEARKKDPHRFRGHEAKYRAANLAKRRESARIYSQNRRLLNPEEAAAYRAVNRLAIREKSRSYYRRNVPAYRARDKQRFRLEKLATPKWLSAIRFAQMEEFYEIAAAREVQTGIKHHVDHMFPLSGITFHGLHVPWNLQVLTHEQNRAKSNRIPLEYAHLTWSVL